MVIFTAFVADNFAFQTRSSLKLEIKMLDLVSGQQKIIYALGETVSVVFTLINKGQKVLKVKDLQDTEIPVNIAWTLHRSDKTEICNGIRGGTGGSYTDASGTIFWTDRLPRYTTILPAQRIEVNIEDLRHFNAGRLDDGNYTLTAEYENGQEAHC